MRVGIHALWTDTDPHGGLANYLSLLIEHLGKVDRKNSYTIYYPRRRALEYASYLPAHFSARVLRPSTSWIQIPFSLPLEILRRPIDLLHCNTIAPPLCPVPFVQALYDVDYAINPEFYPKGIRARLALLVPTTARRARKILTASEFSKKWIIDVCGVPAEKITVIYQGISGPFRHIDDPEKIESFRRKQGIDAPFILYVGKLQKRKNIVRLLEAFARMKKDGRLPHKLFLVGPRTWSSSEIFTTIERLDLGKDVRIPGAFPQEDILLFYNAADLFVFPSLGEGFGIPPLEAMACGTPVVASTASSIPEVVGDAALQIDPFDVGALAQAMYDALSHENLRKQLIERGFKRVGLFSNERMAAKVIETYEDAYRMGSRAPAPSELRA